MSALTARLSRSQGPVIGGQRGGGVGGGAGCGDQLPSGIAQSSDAIV